MYRKSTFRPIAAALVLSAVACQLTAQTVISANPGIDYGTVNRLHAQAAALYDKPAGYPRAAAMLKRAADMLPLDEPRRMQDRSMAAKLWFYAGEHSLARVTMTQAAEEALGMGEVVEAANLYLDAYVFALQEQNRKEARVLYDVASRLSHSRLVAGADRASLTTRLGIAAQRLAGK